jgi:hypothetical protein
MFDWLFPVRRPASRVHSVSSSADSDAHQREDAPGALSRHHGPTVVWDYGRRVAEATLHRSRFRSVRLVSA